MKLRHETKRLPSFSHLPLPTTRFFRKSNIASQHGSDQYHEKRFQRCVTKDSIIDDLFTALLPLCVCVSLSRAFH